MKISAAMPTATTPTPELRRARMPRTWRRSSGSRARATGCVQRLLGVFHQAQHASRALVTLFLERQRRMRLMRVERGLGERRGRSEKKAHSDRDDADRDDAHRALSMSGGHRYLGVRRHADLIVIPVALESRNRSRSSCSRRRITAVSSFVGVVVVEQVQHPVDDQQRELVVGGDAALACLALRDRRAHDDVAEQRGRVARDRSARPARARPGRAGGPRAAPRRPSGTRARRSGRPRRGSVRSARRWSARRRRAATSRPSAPNRSWTRSCVEHQLREAHPARRRRRRRRAARRRRTPRTRPCSSVDRSWALACQCS